jgi:hypothetical protein
LQLCGVVRNRLLQRGFVHAAGRMVASGMAQINVDALRGHAPPETLRWVIKRQAEMDAESAAFAGGGGGGGGGASKVSATKRAVFLMQAVANGMADVVDTLLANGAVPNSEAACCKLLHTCHQKIADEIQCTRVASALLCAFAASQTKAHANGEDGGGGDGGKVASPKPTSTDDDSTSRLPPKEQSELGQVVFAAAEAGRAGLLGVLLQHVGAENIEWRDGQTGSTPLWIACAKRREECTMMLLDAGADINAENPKGRTPLINACQINHCAAVAGERCQYRTMATLFGWGLRQSSRCCACFVLRVESRAVAEGAACRLVVPLAPRWPI